MKIALTPEQTDMVRHAIESGRVHDAAQAVHPALDLWVDRERRRNDLIASLGAAEAALAQGDGTDLTLQSMQALAGDVMDLCRQRVADTAGERS